MRGRWTSSPSARGSWPSRSVRCEPPWRWWRAGTSGGRFLFTSAVPSEGKTFCSSNFAASLAQQGFRTLLIDADLRRPMVSRIFFGEDRQPGLSDLLAAPGEYAADVQPTQVENLDILPAGNRAPNPAELLADPKMLELIQDALVSYQRIVIDSPPVLAVSDSLLIAPHVDVTCLVLPFVQDAGARRSPRALEVARGNSLPARRASSSTSCRAGRATITTTPANTTVCTAARECTGPERPPPRRLATRAPLTGKKPCPRP